MVVLFFGDSLTAGFGDESALGWPGRVIRHIHPRCPQLAAYNLGIRANTSAAVLERFEQESRLRMRPDEPARLVFSVGVADIAQGLSRQQTADAVSEIIRRAKAFCPVLFIGPPPDLLCRFGGEVERRAATIRSICEKSTVPHVSMVDEIDSEGYAKALHRGDGIHPDASGYRILAEAITASPIFDTFFAV